MYLPLTDMYAPVALLISLRTGPFVRVPLGKEGRKGERRGEERRGEVRW